MSHPEWALKFKEKGTSIRCIRGKYYLYKVTSKRDPVTKKPKTITLGQIGVITEEYGLIPTGQKRKGRIPVGASPFKTPPEKLSKEANFIDDLVQLNDPRSNRNQWHSISEILLAALCSVLCGADGWADMEMCTEIKIQFLRQYFPYAHGAPSDDTFRRFFRAVDVGQFEKNFRTWVGRLAKNDKPHIINIDGKCSRHSFDDEQKMLHLVNVFASESKMALGQMKVSEKSNEITALPEILEWLDVNGHIVTIDAMGCQYAVANKILKKGGQYIFSLKGNQASLSKDVELYFQKESMQNATPFIDYDKGHGRIETRKCWVENNVQWLREMHKNWGSIQSIIRIQSTREIKEKITVEDRYYISSLPNETPEKMLENIRSHWSIENSLHWVLDMSFFDDQSRIRKGNAPHAMAILRHVAYNLLQHIKRERQSIRMMRKMCGWDESFLETVISQKLS